MTMACCGGRRAAAAAVASASAPPVTFEYVGRSTLRVVGAVTRRNYWFAQAGARVVVDQRDAASVAGVPQLVHRPAPG
jgi:hypothetical protein